MKAQLGKPTGLALALLATLLATFLAMGVFSVAQADGHSATRSISPTMVAPGGEVTVEIALSGHEGERAVLSDALPDGFSFVPGSIGGGGLPNLSGNRISVVLGDVGTVTEIRYKAMAPDDPGGPFQFSGSFIVAGDSRDIGGDQSVTVAAAATDGTDGAGPAIKLSSYEPGAAVQITINASTATAIRPNQDIRVDLSAFSVPSTIADSAIDISSDGFDGSPSNVVVSGKNVTMTVPNVKASGDDQTENVVGSYGIRIKQSAGVTNAASGGVKTIKWVENAPNTNAAANKEATATIQRVIKLSETDGTRGTETTATFKGFGNGTTTVFLNGTAGADKLAEVTITDNTGILEIDTTPAKFLLGDNNTISARDADGNWQDVSATFEITPTVTLDPEETAVSKAVQVSLSDWLAGPITKVELGGENYVFTNAEGEVIDYPVVAADNTISFPLNVHSTANRGTQTVKVTQGEVSATASLKIGVLALTAQPAMVVPGQEITIQGSDFVANDSFDNVNVGGIDVAISPAVSASSAGDIVITIDVPSPPATSTSAAMPIGNGPKTISVTAIGSNRVAEGEIEVHKAAITLSPETSRRGTTVNVSGSGFPSGDLVQVKYENNANSVTVAAGSADSSGQVDINFVVPSYAKIGTKHDVAAVSVGVYAPVTAGGTHETPSAMVTLSSDTISSGENITITGVNFPAFATVAVMEIGGVDVRPVPAPATSIDGDFESTVLVPQLELGNQTVSVEVSQTTITTFLELSTATVSRAPADVFASLGDRLVRVWYLERSTQVWSFYDPDPDVAAFNTLTEVSSGQNVSIIISSGANIGFQDKTLYPGTNPIALD